MKNLITLFVLLVVVNLTYSQAGHIETKSVSIDNIITFIVNTIESREDDSVSSDNFTFLLQTPKHGLSLEDKVILKQAFKLISNRLSENDHISIVTYAGFHGVALEKTSPKDLKGILFAIENLKASVTELHTDGIELAYTYTKTNFENAANNTVVMIRNPTDKNPSQNVTALQTEVPKAKNNTVLISAIALLPQLISVIKD